jgi:MOSC domain-containing protein YiiM
MPSKPLFSWLKAWRADELEGRLEAIYIAESAAAPMRALQRVEALPGRGLAGDRYATGLGHWKTIDAVEVTLVRAEDITGAQRRSRIALSAGEHRRNLVVSGIPIDAFRKRRFRIGEVLFEFHRLRPPCGYLDRVSGRGTAKSLVKAAGLGARVIEGGVLNVGDRVRVLAEED